MEQKIKIEWIPKDKLIVIPKDNGYEVVESKTQQVHFVSVEDLTPIAEIIDNLDLNYVVQYRYLVRKLLDKLKLDIGIDAFSGGKNRAKYYFKFFYYPLKVLEARGIINYFGRGGIERIR